jgi:MOSC domain-containing protein YiiM
MILGSLSGKITKRPIPYLYILIFKVNWKFVIRGGFIVGKVISINISSKRGVDKASVGEVMVVEGWGLEGDAHGGDWDRQVSILPAETLERVPQHKVDEVLKGGYTENFTVLGIPPEEMIAGIRWLSG